MSTERKYFITALNTSTCINEYEIKHFLRFNNLRDSDLTLISYCTESKTYYTVIEKELDNKYKSKRAIVTFK